MFSYYDLVRPETLVEIKKKSPNVTQVPVDAARMVVSGMQQISSSNPSHEDTNGMQYWTASLKEVWLAARFPEDSNVNTVGRACRSMGLVSWREGNGYHVAWSKDQLSILAEYFKKVEGK
jgi:hypothetical protein